MSLKATQVFIPRRPPTVVMNFMPFMWCRLNDWSMTKMRYYLIIGKQIKSNGGDAYGVFIIVTQIHYLHSFQIYGRKHLYTASMNKTGTIPQPRIVTISPRVFGFFVNTNLSNGTSISKLPIDKVAGIAAVT